MSAGDVRAVVQQLAVMTAPGVLPSDIVSGDQTQHHSDVGNPSIDELQSALALSDDIDRMNAVDMLRLLLKQHRLLIRDAIWRRTAAGLAASLRSVSTTVSHSSDSQKLSSGSCGSVRSSSGSCADSDSQPKKLKVSPPKVFRCPVCPAINNEKDFSRHILAWLTKTEETGPVKHGHCGGIRDPNHPLLRKFPEGTLFERVSRLVAYIRGLVHPGAYDALKETSSGREFVVAAKIEELLAD